jgi:hypothetical protein
VQRILAGTSVVEAFSIQKVEGDRIVYRIQAHGGAERLARALRLTGLIEQERAIDTGFPDDSFGDKLVFFYNP